LTTLETRPSESCELWGSQTPRFRSVPKAEQSLGDAAVKFAARAGLMLDPWQQDVLRGAMGRAPGGRWAARNVGLLVPRQNGKGAILEARELYGMFVLKEPLIIHSAHQFDSSQKHFERVLTLIEGNPDLKRHVAHVYSANGKESIKLKSGAKLQFKARSNGSARGFSCETLILDEAMILPDSIVASMRPTLLTRPEAQIWYTSSAGTPESHALWRIVKRGRAKSARLAYWEWGSPQGVDLSSWDAVVPHIVAANPAVGRRISLDDLEDEYNNYETNADEFLREHLGIWDDQARVNIFSNWESLNDPASEIVRRPMYAIAVAEDRSWSCIAAAGSGPAAMHVEVGDYRPGTGWLVRQARELQAKYGAASFVVRSNSGAGSLIGDLENANVTVVKVSQQDYAQACGDFYDAVVGGELRHGGQGELDAAVGGTVRKSLGDAFIWDQRKSTLDISPLEAVTLAFWGHVNAAQAVPNIW
jgi:phage terminase large subunit-like protein